LSALADIYSQDELREMLTQAIKAKHSIVTKGAVQEIRVLDRLTRFHKTNLADLNAHIAELQAALGKAPQARSFGVYLG
jgi:hypothetical protein